MIGLLTIICSLHKSFSECSFPRLTDGKALLVQTNGFIPAKMEAIQIHLVSDSHWVTSSRLGDKVTLYDSRKVGSHLSSTLIHQLSQVYKSSICQSGENAFLTVNIATLQKQCGSDDCGVLAIAFALHSSMGHCLDEIEFDQANMQTQLLTYHSARLM